jgi:hypothetical protein
MNAANLHLRIVSLASASATDAGDGWIINGKSAAACVDALEEAATLGLHSEGRLATDEEVALVRHALAELGTHAARLWRVRIDAHLEVSDRTHTLAEVAACGRRRHADA